MNNKSDARVRKSARGYRPRFFQDPINDKLLSMILSMANEMWVMRERLDTLEAVAEGKDLISQREIDEFEASPERDEKREEMRQEFFDRIFYLMLEEAESVKRNASKEAYDQVIRDSANE